MDKKIYRFNKDYFRSLKTLKEKELYYINFIKKSFLIMEKGGISYDN